MIRWASGDTLGKSLLVPLRARPPRIPERRRRRSASRQRARRLIRHSVVFRRHGLEEHILACGSCAERAAEAQDYVDAMRVAALDLVDPYERRHLI
jgi:hypothetical protein